MNDQDEIYCERQISALERMATAFERLAGVRGPEQSLVRESRSDEQTDGAEYIEQLTKERDQARTEARKLRDAFAQGEQLPWENAKGMARRDGRPPEEDGLSPSPSPPCSGLAD